MVAYDSERIAKPNNNTLFESYPPPYKVTYIPYEEAYPAPVVSTITATIDLTATVVETLLPTASLTPTEFVPTPPVPY